MEDAGGGLPLPWQPPDRQPRTLAQRQDRQEPPARQQPPAGQQPRDADQPLGQELPQLRVQRRDRIEPRSWPGSGAWHAPRGREERFCGRNAPGHLLIIGGAEDRCCGTGPLERFVRLSGGPDARIVLVTTATGMPEQVHAEYEQVFRKLGVERTRELRLHGRADADGAETAEMLAGATGVFFSGGDQSRIRTLVGSRTNDILREQLSRGLVVAGTSAGATALGRTMILGGQGPEVAAAAVRTCPGLGLVPKLLIDMHFGERGRLPRLLSAVALDPDHLGVGIDENTAILLTGTSFEVLGTGVATVADAEGSTVVHPAGDYDPITLYDVRLHLLPAGCLFDIEQRIPSIGPAHDRY